MNVVFESPKFATAHPEWLPANLTVLATERDTMTGPGTTAPVEPGEEYTVEIREVGEEGDGVAYVEDFVVLIPDGNLGERALIEIRDVEESFATAELLEGDLTEE